MSVYVQWDSDEKKAVIWSFIGRWSWSEYQAAWEMMQAMLDSVDRPVDFIYDVRRMSMLPADTISRMKNSYLNMPANAGRMIAVGVDTDLQLFWNTFTELPYASHLKMTYFETLEEAIAYLSAGEESSS